MKEYKIVKQRGHLLKNTDKKFEDELNTLAQEGWRVVSAVTDQGNIGLKVVLERDKNR